MAQRPWEVILVGDLFYERPLAERLLAWLKPLGRPALLGDPGRNYFPKSGVRKLASYSVPTPRDLEDREARAKPRSIASPSGMKRDAAFQTRSRLCVLIAAQNPPNRLGFCRLRSRRALASLSQ